MSSGNFHFFQGRLGIPTDLDGVAHSRGPDQSSLRTEKAGPPQLASWGGPVVFSEIVSGARGGYFLANSAMSFAPSLALTLTSFTCLPRVSCQISTL